MEKIKKEKQIAIEQLVELIGILRVNDSIIFDNSNGAFKIIKLSN